MEPRSGSFVLALLLGVSFPTLAQGYRLPARGPSSLAVAQKAAAPAGAQAVASLLANAGFETNGGAGSSSFAGWTVVDLAGGSGSWYVQTGVESPLNGLTVPPPPEGSFQAMTDQTDPGSHVLYQDVVIPAGGARLSFYLTLESRAPITVPDPPSLDFSDGEMPNQQFRVDVMDPAADAFDVGSGVLMNVYQTAVGDPTSSGPQLVYADLSAFAGRTVRLRFAETDNRGVFNAGIDAVSLLATGNVPAAGTTGLLVFGVALALAGAFALRRMFPGR